MSNLPPRLVVPAPRAKRAARPRSPSRGLAPWHLAFAVPALLLFLAFSVWPILYNLSLSFYKYDWLTTKTWVGFRNFANLTTDAATLNALRVTVTYLVGTYVPVWTLALLLALALNSRLVAMKGFLRTAYFVPVVMSIVVSSVIWKLLFHRDGLLNAAVVQPLTGQRIDWLTSEDWAPLAIILMSVWKEVGFYMVIFLAGLQQVPRTLYEAAAIDGARGRQVFWYVTLPLLRPTFALVTIYAFIQGLQAFVPQWVMADGGPNMATTTIGLLIYRKAFVWLDVGSSSAVAVLLFVVTGIVTIALWRVQRGSRQA